MSSKTVERMKDQWDVSVRRLQKQARIDYPLNRCWLSFHLGRHLSVIIAAIVISEYLQNWSIYIVAVMLIGAHQLGLGHIGYHERTHDLISHDSLWNDRIGAILIHLVGGNIIMGYENFRPRHLTHHRYLNTDLDPDAWAPKAFASTPLHRHVFDVALILSGLAYLRLLRAFVSKHLRFRSYGSITGLAIAGLIVFSGLLSGFYPAKIFVLYWLVPAATWCYFCFFVRSYAEHPVVGGDANVSLMVFTREVRPTWFDRLFVATSGFSFHLSHHIAPFVPFYHLHHFHEQVVRDSSIRSKMVLYHGYHHLLFASLRKRRMKQLGYDFFSVS
ncbi:fatty acid desaturase family protein [Synechococcus sp. PROS-7-1]|uniref:fatty acid desaturase n=1 Tax=Synechococcus sp. PROS-7-1 TaxID=1442556 RepID=UPI000CA36219|nr:fatty acid desaturase [Synechococcus sp. PROS-7-1]ATV95736.1 fatty acid desaturase family protein [Synechococcus sp. PROS-7-1]QNI86509.1 fatty acid desaturase family protein [Synechococcus sp. PROS-7-1]